MIGRSRGQPNSPTRPPGPPGRGPSPLACLLGLAALSASGCTEDVLTGVDPDGAPGEGSATIELELSAADLPDWRDTTFAGYALSATSGIRLVAATSDLQARIVARVTTLPDSVFFEDGNVEVERFENARLRLIVDTTMSMLPDGGASLAAHALTTSFDERQADWTNAADGQPWTTPGGDLGAELGTLTLDSLDADTVFLPIDVPADSLLEAWRADGGEPGFAVGSATSGASFTIRQVVLAFDVKPVGRDTLLETLRAASPSTFIFDPETPPVDLGLRLGGLPAARAYFDFRLPESVDGTPLRGARINRATLLLTSDVPPGAPFTTPDTVFASAFSLLSDPFASGPKTPVGSTLGQSVAIAPEDAGEGVELQLPLTGLVQSWAAADPDSMPNLRLGVRLLPEGGDLGFYRYGSVDEPARAPRVRILLTPETPFDLP